MTAIAQGRVTHVAPPARATDHGSPAPAQGWKKRWKQLVARLTAERTRRMLRRKAVAAWMNLLILLAAGVTAFTAGYLNEQPWPVAGTWAPGALRLFTLWCFAFLPGWLYIRFLNVRAKALWNEYVLTLHRLGWDRPRNLPEPLLSSGFHQVWKTDRGTEMNPHENIYRQKFEAYYGRDVMDEAGAAADGRAKAAITGDQDANPEDFTVHIESMFPIFLATAVFAVGWSATLWDTGFLTAPEGLWDVLKYGFVGAYAFVVSMLVRRFFQSDLRPSAYAAAVLRIMLVLLIVAVLHQLLASSAEAIVRGELAFAFLVGFFPLVGLSFIQQAVSRIFGGIVPSLKAEYPLDQLDGFSLWYEARLTEEGVEDMQNLMTMNIIDVVLHTRVPAGRLVDWIDQAFLVSHLEPTTREQLTSARAHNDNKCVGNGAATRVALRRFGIRTATDLLKAFGPQKSTSSRGQDERSKLDPDTIPGFSNGQLRTLITVLEAEEGLVPIWNWQRNGVDDGGRQNFTRDLDGASNSRRRRRLTSLGPNLPTRPSHL